MQYVQLRSYDRYIEAHLQLQQLEAEGIRAVLQDEYTVTIDPFLSNAVGGIKLMVPDVQWERARSIIEKLEAAYQQTFTCPVCGSHSIQRVVQKQKPVRWYTPLLSMLKLIVLREGREVYRCSSCGHETPVSDEPKDR